jgi:hypothetical protein
MLRATFRELSDGSKYFPTVPEQDADVLEVLIGKMGRTETSMPFSANAPACSGKPSLVSQSDIYRIAALRPAELWTGRTGNLTDRPRGAKPAPTIRRG